VAGTHGFRSSLSARASIALALAALAAAALPSAAAAEMRSKMIDRHLCKTVHGGRFVPIPGFPGEKIDRRLLPDIRWMKRRFDVFITDGYSTDPVHAWNGEHPIGLAADIVPNRAKGGTWRKIRRLARKAEPRQNYPIAPWRWVGWNGDPGHGRGDHLHLSWMHTSTRPKHPARVVYTRRCPEAPENAGARKPGKPRTGGVSPTRLRGSTGGTAPARLPHRLAKKLAPVVAEGR
jgi:hypothetical protein